MRMKRGAVELEMKMVFILILGVILLLIVMSVNQGQTAASTSKKLSETATLLAASFDNYVLQEGARHKIELDDKHKVIYDCEANQFLVDGEASRYSPSVLTISDNINSQTFYVKVKKIEFPINAGNYIVLSENENSILDYSKDECTKSRYIGQIKSALHSASLKSQVLAQAECSLEYAQIIQLASQELNDMEQIEQAAIELRQIQDKLTEKSCQNV